MTSAPAPRLSLKRGTIRRALAIAIAAVFGFVPAVAAQPSGIERVDFRDVSVVFEKQSYRLKDGRNAVPDKNDAELIVTAAAPVFGYVDGYSGELAVVMVHAHDYGATGEFSELNLFGLRAGKPVLVVDLPGGDRAEGGLHTAKIVGHRLVVDVYAPAAGGGVCCPGFVDTVRYRIAGGKLVRDGKPSRRTAVQDKDY